MRAGPRAVIPHLAQEPGRRHGVLAVILFGSLARGEPRPFSDIDICVVTDRQITEDEKAGLSGYSSPVVEISLFYDLPVVIRYRVIKEGNVLYCRDGTLSHSGGL